MTLRQFRYIVIGAANCADAQDNIAPMHQKLVTFLQLAGKAPDLFRVTLAPVGVLGNQAVAPLGELLFAHAA